MADPPERHPNNVPPPIHPNAGVISDADESSVLFGNADEQEKGENEESSQHPPPANPAAAVAVNDNNNSYAQQPQLQQIQRLHQLQQQQVAANSQQQAYIGPPMLRIPQQPAPHPQALFDNSTIMLNNGTQQQQQQQQQHYLPSPAGTSSLAATMQYYEARMRDHAAAYASAAAGAAWAAAQVAVVAADYANGTGPPPPPHMLAAWNHPQQQQQQPMISPGGMYHPAAAASFWGPAASFGGTGQDGSTFSSLAQHPYAPPQPPPYAPWEDAAATQLQQQLFVPDNGATFEPYNNNNRSEAAAAANENGDSSNHDDDSEDHHDNSRHRRKRQQRLPPDDASIPRVIAPRRQQYHQPHHQQQQYNNNHHYSVNAQQQQQQQSRCKIRRRLRSDGDSSSSGSFYHSSGRGSSADMNNSRRRKYNQKKKARSDESLLGKTAVAALYEWCSRRRGHMPSFVLQEKSETNQDSQSPQGTTAAGTTTTFECIVYLEPDMEWGRGDGCNKGAAKQDAARKALQELCPGVRFDETSGLVIEVPSSSSSSRSSNKNTSRAEGEASKRSKLQQAALLEDLAPNLEKQLAIGSAARPNKLPGSSQNQNQQQTKRSLEHDPSTTSEEEYADAYYTTRGASILSKLLFSTLQIDPRTPTAPTISYKATPVRSSSSTTYTHHHHHHLPHQRKRNATTSSTSSTSNSAVVQPNANLNVVVEITRGAFTCTAQIEVHETTTSDIGGDNDRKETHDVSTTTTAPDDEDDAREEASTTNKQESTAAKEERETNGEKQQLPETAPNVEESNNQGDDTSKNSEQKSIRILQAEGIGASKREARHSACAHLLALLFPNCQTMVEVKQAAEAAIATYAANKSKSATTQQKQRGDADQEAAAQTPLDNDEQRQDDDDVDDKKPAAVENNSNNDDCSALAPSGRKKQLDAIVEKALQNSNERDEEGRCLPEELTADDVGRTVLRLAEPGDMCWIEKQFSGKEDRVFQESPLFASARSRSFSLDVEGGTNEETTPENEGNLARSLWSPLSIILLLCRKIAAYEDPPLGCAVLRLDFCMERGRLLRLATIATEPHLPQERFVECLEGFARCMQSTLEVQHYLSARSSDPGAVCLSTTSLEDSKRIIESFVNNDGIIIDSTTASYSIRGGASSPLQSVQEESEVSDSSAEKRPARRPSKPSKRSRFK